MESKRYLVNKNIHFEASGIGVLWPLERGKKSKNIKFYMINRYFGKIS